MEKSEPVIFVSAPNYKLSGKKNIEVEEILNAPFYLTERNANYRQALEQELAPVSYTHLMAISADTCFKEDVTLFVLGEYKAIKKCFCI